MQKSIEDCYFYYYSTCKNEQCAYRHCAQALGKEVTCKNWLLKQCFDVNCPNRHMAITKNRSQIPCFWESSPSGCQKAHCTFFHRSSEPKPTQIVTPPVVLAVKEEIKSLPNPIESNQSTANDVTVTNTPSPIVTPVIVQMNEGDEEEDEERDDDELLKEKSKSLYDKKQQRILNLKKSDKEVVKPELTIQIKTLEEILKEKKALKEASSQVATATKLEENSQTKDLVEKRIVVIESDKIEKQHVLGKRLFKSTRQKSNVIEEDEIKKDKNIMNIITNTLSENANSSLPTKPELVHAQEPSIKIKTLDEIRAEKRAKQEEEEEKQRRLHELELQERQKADASKSPTNGRKLRIKKPPVDDEIVSIKAKENNSQNKRKTSDTNNDAQFKKTKSLVDDQSSITQIGDSTLIESPIHSTKIQSTLIDNSLKRSAMVIDTQVNASNVFSQFEHKVKHEHENKKLNGKFDDIDNELETLMMLCDDEEDNL